MNNPLTVDELKALKSGDWVWLIDNNYGFSTYKRKSTRNNDKYFIENKDVERWGYSYLDYGKTWLAYKNKEQAENN